MVRLILPKGPSERVSRMGDSPENVYKGNCPICDRELIIKKDTCSMVCFAIRRKIVVSFVCHDCTFTFPLMIECCECFKPISSHDAIQCGCDFIYIKMSVVRYYCTNKCAVKYNQMVRKESEIEMKPRCMTCMTSNIYGQKVKKLKKCGICRRVYYCSVKCQRKDWKEHQKVCGD